MLYGLCEHNFTANPGPGSVLIERWSQDWEGPPEIFDRTRAIVPLPSLMLRAGEQASFRAHRDIARIAALDDCAVIVSFTRMQATRLRWIYDSYTLLPARAEAGDLGQRAWNTRSRCSPRSATRRPPR